MIVFLDDILIIGNGSFDEHLKQVETVLKKLLGAGMQVNPLKSFWFQAEVEYLGYIINRIGIKPQPKKIEKMFAIKVPRSKTELRSVVGMINYYRDICQGRAHMLAPLTKMCVGKAKFEWSEETQKAFNLVKEKIVAEAMLAHPNCSKPFDVHTDSSAYQLGGVVSQEGKPIVFFSKKLNSAQKNYPITEKELLSIVEMLKEFKYLLLGNCITIHTDHRYLTYPETKHTCDRVLQQRLLLEEYGCDIKYIEGSKNVVADALSRLEANLVEPVINESHFTRYRYQENVSVPVDMKVIAKMQRADK